jgi:hypothetical protein
MEQPWPLASWPGVPTRVLIGRDDRLSHPDAVVERLEAYRATALPG